MRADAQLQLAEVELVDISVDDVQLVAADASTGVGEAEVSAASGDRYLAVEADRIAARASTAGTRRQYASIYRSVATWLAAELGWVVAEYGRQPWVVEGVLPTFLGVSTTTTGNVWTSLAGFVLFYSTLAIVDVGLLVKYIRLGPREHAA